MVGILILVAVFFVMFPSALLWLIVIALGLILIFNFPWFFVGFIFLVLLGKVLEV